MIGAAAFFKGSSSRGIQHEHESFNPRVVPASSRSGLGVLVAAGFNSFDSGVETVSAPGPCVVSGGAHRVCSGGSEIVHVTAEETEGISGLLEVS